MSYAHMSVGAEITLTGAAQKLTAASLVCRCQVDAPPTNTSNVTLTLANGGTRTLIPGSRVTFNKVDVYALTVQGTSGDMCGFDGEIE